MEAQLVEREGVKATVKVTVPASDVDRTFQQVLRQLARQVKVPGFRPGKAPEGVLVKKIGAESLAQEVRDALVDEHYADAVRELDLQPVHAHFHADAPEKGQPFEFEVHIDLYPDFELPDFDQIVIDTEVPPVTDDMVERTVERLRREHAPLVPVDRPSQPGDTVMIETIGEDGDEGPSSQMPVDLETVDEHLAEQLLGRTIGEEVELQLGGPDSVDDEEDATEATDPEAAEDTDASEPPRTLKVRIANVQEKDKPDADDEFAKTLGFETWDDTVSEIRASIQAQLERDTFEEQREEFVEKLMAETEVELPPTLVNRRKINLLENLSDDLRQRGLTLEAYLEDLEEKGTREAFEAELTEAAERGVERDLILEQLLDRRGTSVTDAEFQQAIRHLASREGVDVQKFKRERDESWLANYRFLLARDKALREVVREKVGAPASARDDADDADGPVDDSEDEVVEAGSAPPAGQD